MDNRRRTKSEERNQETNPAEIRKGRLMLGFEGMNFEQKRKPYQNINNSSNSTDINTDHNRSNRQDNN